MKTFKDGGEISYDYLLQSNSKCFYSLAKKEVLFLEKNHALGFLLFVTFHDSLISKNKVSRARKMSVRLPVFLFAYVCKISIPRLVESEYFASVSDRRKCSFFFF